MAFAGVEGDGCAERLGVAWFCDPAGVTPAAQNVPAQTMLIQRLAVVPLTLIMLVLKPLYAGAKDGFNANAQDSCGTQHHILALHILNGHSNEVI